MPTVLRIRGYRFFFFAAHRYEPPHIHVAKEDRAAKFWLDPVELAFNAGFRSHELTEIRNLTGEHVDELHAAWYKCFGSQR
jgi:hypothetical protein